MSGETKTRTLYSYAVLTAKRLGNGSYAPYKDEGNLIAVEVEQGIAPRVNRLKLAVNLPNLSERAWNWRAVLNTDDRIMVKRSDGMIVFVGYLVDPHWSYGDSTEHVQLTAVGQAARLTADHDCLVFGRRMIPYNASSISHYSGLRCEFNAGGRPNRYASGDADADETFTYDGDPDAAWWTVRSAIEYLVQSYTPDVDVMATPSDADLGSLPDVKVVVSAEGLSLWAAIAAVCGKAGADAYEECDIATGTSTIRVIPRGGGMEVELYHQAPAADGSLPQLDLGYTNATTAQVAEATSSCVTRPTVAGGRDLFEIVVDLQKAWDPADLAEPSDKQYAWLSQATETVQHLEYYRRYCTGGSEFMGYADAGRLWVANEDGRYSDLSLTVPDMATVTGDTGGVWPKFPCPPLPLLSLDGGGRPRAPFMEISWDGGSTWFTCQDCQILPDRLGVRITKDNLLDMPARSATEGGGGLSPDDDNLWKYCLSRTSNLKLRLVCTVAGPQRRIEKPERRATGGTAFGTTRWFDRGALGQRRTVSEAAETAWYSRITTLPAADAAEGNEIVALAQKLQDAHEGRTIEASFTIEWPDIIGLYQLTDQVTRIHGLDYALGVAAGGGGTVYPRITQIRRNLQATGYNTTIALSTPRFVAVLPGVSQ